MIARDWLAYASNHLKAASLQCADPRLHAHQILESVSGWSSSKILAGGEERLEPALLQKLEAFLKRRLAGEPFQYILGRESFWKDEFEVGPGVLIPRRETEHVVEFLATLQISKARVVELGAGSGNIGISTLREKPDWQWFAAEKSPKAFDYARRNAARLLDASSSYRVVQEDFFTFAPPLAPWDIVVSNPPYVATGEIPSLSIEVLHEPSSALDGGEDGLTFVRRLAKISLDILKPSGFLVLEIGSDQGKSGLEILSSLGYEEVNVKNDLANLPRVLIGRRKA